MTIERNEYFVWVECDRCDNKSEPLYDEAESIKLARKQGWQMDRDRTLCAVCASLEQKSVPSAVG